MLKTDKKSKSMSDKAINHNVLLTVKNGSCKLTLTFKGMTVGTFTVSGIRYQVTATGKTTSVKLVKADTKKKTFTVPATVSYKNTTCKVTQIAKNSFKSCKKLTTVTLGKNITTVEKNAFKGCSKLKTVKLAKGTAKKLKTSLTKQIKKAGVKKVKVK